ncbi:MAG: hypothetical protein ABJB32_04750 [Verrucomicrobiota bacterium]
MHAEFRQFLAQCELKVAHDKIALGGYGIIGGMERAAERKQEYKSSQQKECSKAAVRHECLTRSNVAEETRSYAKYRHRRLDYQWQKAIADD